MLFAIILLPGSNKQTTYLLTIMDTVLDAKQYGLNSRTRLIQISDKEIAIFVNRKSRFIMKDGLGFLEKVNIVKKQYPDITISLKITSAICSKTLKYLKEYKINIYQQ